MKKILVLIIVALCSCQMFAMSEVTDSAQAGKSKKTSYSFYKNYSHWSLAVSGGFNFLMAERNQIAGEEIKNFSKENFLGEFNFDVKYSINPVWGVALEYAYSPINKNCIFIKDAPNVHPEKNAQGHQIYALVDVNLLNLFSRYRAHTEWGWYAGIGIGLLTFNTCDEFVISGKDDTWSVIPMFSFDSHVDYSPINDLSIFLKVAMGTYLRDDVNACKDGAMNDWNLYGGLGLRWNISTQGKKHVNYIDMHTYQQSAEGNGDANKNAGLDSATQSRIKKLEDQVKDLQGTVQGTSACCSAIDQVKKHADDNTEEIKKLRTQLDTLHRTTYITAEVADNSVYFPHNSAEISEKDSLIIEKVARIMMANPTLQLDITAFCSKIGNTEKNQIVGQWRIEAVTDLLVSKYHIDVRRIHSEYKGQVFEGLSRENRRCDLKLR